MGSAVEIFCHTMRMLTKGTRIGAGTASRGTISDALSKRLACPGKTLYHYVRNDKLEIVMANVVTINRPEVVAQIEEAAKRLTAGNKTEAVALAIRRLLDETARAGPLFGAHAGSVHVGEGVDLIAPALDVTPDAESGREIAR
jgi:hypothetical protein